MTYLARLRQWKEQAQWPGMRSLSVQRIPLLRRKWWCALTSYPPPGSDYDAIRRTGDTREEACQRCYEEAVKRGIITPAEHHEQTDPGGPGQLITGA